MSRPLRAGLDYFASVFALGFLLGTVRVFALAPQLGAWRATLVELPVMLAASWWLCRWALRRWQVPRRVADGALIGGTAFACLMLAEVTLGTTLLGRDLAGQVAAMTSGPGALGLAAQLLYACFPLIQLALEPDRDEPPA